MDSRLYDQEEGEILIRRLAVIAEYAKDERVTRIVQIINEVEEKNAQGVVRFPGEYAKSLRYAVRRAVNKEAEKFGTRSDEALDPALARLAFLFAGDRDNEDANEKEWVKASISSYKKRWPTDYLGNLKVHFEHLPEPPAHRLGLLTRLEIAFLVTEIALRGWIEDGYMHPDAAERARRLLDLDYRFKRGARPTTPAPEPPEKPEPLPQAESKVEPEEKTPGIAADLDWQTVLPGQDLAEPETPIPPVDTPSREQEIYVDPNYREPLLAYLKKVAEKNTKLDLHWLGDKGRLEIALDSVYIALSADRKTDLDRDKDALLHRKEIEDMFGAGAFESMSGHRRAQADAAVVRLTTQGGGNVGKDKGTVNLAEVIRTRRRVVIRGEPGSGKSTLGRWIVLHFAQAMREQIEKEKRCDVKVGLSQVDPEVVRSSSDQQISLGLARLPALLRIASYAEELAKLGKSAELYSLDEFLGRDPESEGIGDNLSPDTRNQIIRQSLENDEAIVILDGLDELNQTYREQIVKEIARFILHHTKPASSDGEEDLPLEKIGNRVIVTTRIVGYNQTTAIRASCSHYDIRPMTRHMVEKFATYWAAAVNAVMVERDRLVDAQALIRELYSKPRLHELARNPLLITILATVHWVFKTLPERRVDLYAALVDQSIELWLARPESQEQKLTRRQILAALQPVAAELQAMSGERYIGFRQIEELIEEPLAKARGLHPESWEFQSTKKALFKVIVAQFGLLKETGQGNFEFHHRTFQEYFAALQMLSDRENAPKIIRERLSDPLWRVPVILALGIVASSTEFKPHEKSELLLGVLAADDRLSFLPRATLILISAVPDMVGVPPDVLENVVHRLLKAYEHGVKETREITVSDRIETAFRTLMESQQRDVVERLLIDILSNPEAPPTLVDTVAAVLRRVQWFSAEIVKKLLDRVGASSSRFEISVSEALAVALGRPEAEMSWIGGEDSTLSLFSSSLPMRWLLRDEEILAWLKGEPDWIWLLIALYGGVPFDLEEGKSSSLWQALDRDYITHDLCDPDLSAAIRNLLALQNPAGDLKEHLLMSWRTGSPAAAAEACVGLAAIGVDPLSLFEADPSRVDAIKEARSRFAWMRARLGRFLARSGESLIRFQPASSSEAYLQWVHQLVISSGSRPVEMPLSIWSQPGSRQNHSQIAETLVPSLLDFGDPARRQPILDLVYDVDLTVIDILLILLDIPHSVNFRAAGCPSWSVVPYPVLRTSTAGLYFAVLHTLPSAPRRLHRGLGFLLGACKALLKAHPDFIEETISFLKLSSGEFREGFESSPAGACLQRSDLENLRKQDVPEKMIRALSEIDGVAFASDPAFEKAVSKCLSSEAFALYGTKVIAAGQHGLPPSLLGSDESESIDQPARAASGHAGIRILWLESRNDTAGDIDKNLSDGQIRLLSSHLNDPSLQCHVLIESLHFDHSMFDRLQPVIRKCLDEIGDPLFAREVWRYISALIPERKDIVDQEIVSILGSPTGAFESDATEDLPYTLRQMEPVQALNWRLNTKQGVSEYRELNTSSTLMWAVAGMYAIACDVEGAGSALAASSGRWAALLEEDPTPALNSVIRDAANFGLEYTAEARPTLEALIDAGRQNVVDAILPLLHCEAPQALLSDWNPSSDSLSRWISLVLAENRTLNLKIVRHLMDLLESGNDRLRHRARLALHGSYVYLQNQNRIWRTSQVPLEVWQEIAKAATAKLTPKDIRTVLGWMFTNVHVDKPETVQHFLSQAIESSGRDEAALWFLGQIQSIDENGVDLLISGLQTTLPKLQAELLETLTWLVHLKRLPGSRFGSLHAVLQGLSLSVRKGMIALPGRTTKIFEICESVAESDLPSVAAAAEARRRIQKSTAWLTDDVISKEATCMASLNIIGDASYIPLQSYWRDAGNRARIVKDKQRVLSILLELIKVSRVYADPSPIVCEIVTATAALATHEPVVFFSLADTVPFEELFAQIVMEDPHWANRMAAIQLLGGLRLVKGPAAKAFRAALQDVSYVSEAAIRTASGFRQIEGKVFDELIELLRSESAAVAESTSIFLGVATSVGSNAVDYRRLLDALEQAITTTSIARPVYVMVEDAESTRIEYRGMLDRTFDRQCSLLSDVLDS